MATGAGVALVAPLASVSLVSTPASAALDVEPGESLAFDFGCPDSPVAEGYIGVDPSTTYDAETGYGLDGTVDCRDRDTQEDDALRDFTVGWDYEFLVDLADGEYFVTVVSGDEEAANNTAVTVNGEDLGTLQPRDPGEYAEQGVYTDVEDGQLSIAMRDDGRLNAVVISQIEPPTGLTEAEVSVDPPSVTLAWDEMPGASAYTVYRSPAEAENYTAIGTVESPGLTDEDVEAGFAYDYTVTQTNAAGAESGRSEPLTVAVTDPDVEAPPAPEQLSLDQADSSGTTISWAGSDDAEIYHVYRGLTRDGSFERVAETAEETFTASGESEHSWFYAVVAVNSGGVSERSESLVTPRTAAPVELGNVHPQCGEGSFDAEVIQDGNTWSAVSGDTVVYEDYSMHEAIQAGVDSLSADRTEQERVVVHGAGTMPADIAVELPSHTSLEVCGTLHVAGNESAFSYEQHMGAVAIRYAEDISVPFLNVTGEPNFAVYLRTSSDVHFGQIDLRLSGGHGMRMDSRDDDSVRNARNISIDDVYVSGTETHGVETYGVDGFDVGTVEAVDTGHAGVLLNNTVNADIDSVVGHNAAAGTGYATFRTANRNGMLDGAYPTNIRVGEVIAHGGGRGIFCVSESGGVEIERVEISGTENNAMLLENCHNVTIASEGGVVEGPGEIVISARDEFDNNTDLTLENLTLRDTAVRELVCGERTVLRNLTLENSEIEACAEVENPTDPATESPEPTPSESPSPTDEASSAPTDPTAAPEETEPPPSAQPGSEDDSSSGDDPSAEAAGGDLATTGSNTQVLPWAAVALMVLGIGLLVLRRVRSA